MKRRILLGLSGVTLVALAFAGWSSAVVAAGPDASVATTSLGKIIVDGKGMTAYFFDRDTPNSGSSSCAGQCAVNWPAITSATAVPTVVGITGTVGTIAATKQITINGRPIYTYLFDTAAGATNGQGVGGVWFVISPAGEEMKAAKPVTAGPDAMVGTTTLGKIIVDGKGMTAYFFDRDTANSGVSACTGGCAAAWPAITAATATPSVTGITGTVGIIAASKQITINGRPIYTYANDDAVGSTNGQGVGGVWFVISPAGEEMKAAKPVESPQPTKSAEPTKSPKPVKSTKTSKQVKTDASVAKTAVGKVVVNGKGMTAYFFDKDKAHSGKSSCTGQCAAIWPAITSKSATPTVSGITGTVGIIKRVDGRKQVTINGRPIYTYVYDKARGATNGQGVLGIWYVVSPSGKEIKSVKAAKAIVSVKPKVKPTVKPTAEPSAQSTDSAIPYDKSNY